MAEVAPTDQIVVLRYHLEEILRTLDAAYGFHSADDLARQYKSMTTRFVPSNLTKSLERSLARVGGYLEIQEEIDELLPTE
jgi:hypothetical protein